MLSDLEIRLEIGTGRGRYVAGPDGDAAELTFSITSPTLRIADHTGVPASLRGTGIGQRMVERFVQDAREQGFKIVPLCPFVNAQRRRHPEWADAFSV